MFTYALRCKEVDFEEMVQNARHLSVLPDNKDGYSFYEEGGVIWDYIGYKILENGETLTDGQGNKYVHVNVKVPFNLRERAQEVAVSRPEIAVALSQVGKYFITDNEGNVVLPQFPIRTFL